MLYVLALIVLGLSFRDDKNFLSILIIITFNYIFPLTVYDLSLNANITIKLLIYSLSAYTFFKLRSDSLAKFSLALLSCMVIAELYWLSIDYDQAPPIVFCITVVAATILARSLLLKRATIFKFWSKEIKKTPIDWGLYNLIGLAIPLVAIFVIEYFFRHILTIQSFIIYNVYSELTYLTSTAVLWVLLNYAMRKTALFQA